MRHRRRHSPFARDGLLATLVFASALVCATGSEGHGITVAGVAAGAAVSAPIAVRTRCPLTVLAATTALIFPALALLSPMSTAVAAPMLALYTVATTSPRSRALLAGAAMVPVALLATLLFSKHGLLGIETLKNVVFIGLPLVLGIAVRDRRAYIGAMKERAERAEATREEEARRRVGEERLRIAREVHDVVAHALVAINVQAGVATHLRRPEAAQDALDQIKHVSGEALTDLRATLGVLRETAAPAPTRPTATLAAIGDLADGVRAAGIAVNVEAAPLERPVPSGLESTAYRIVQEALTNVLRHARRARRADVRLDIVDGALAIDVADDGEAGAPVGQGGSGNGLRGMRERAAAVGGAVEAGPRRDGGWRVHARLPLPVGVE